MRLRSYTAATIPEAMALVREHLGPEAIIVSTQSLESGGASVTAALEEGDPPAGSIADDAVDAIHEALAAHGVPPRLIEKLLKAAAELDSDDTVLALAGALDAVFTFAPIGDRPAARPLMLVGPPGAGKTISTAKLAARAVLGHRPTRVVTADTVRAGGIEQLEAFTRLLELPLHTVESTKHLTGLVSDPVAGEMVLVDTAGINPYNASDRADLAGFIAAAEAEPIFVVPGGGDLFDTVEMAGIFAELGCRRMLATRLDMVQRLGSVLAAAEAANLAFCDVGITPSVADGLTPLTPVALARLLLPDPALPADPSAIQPHVERAPS